MRRRTRRAVGDTRSPGDAGASPAGADQPGDGAAGGQPAHAPGAAASSDPRGMCVQVHVCAALCALATPAGLAYTCGALGEQIRDGRLALTLGITWLALGVIVGLWVPRRVIRRRLTAAGQVRLPGETGHGTPPATARASDAQLGPQLDRQNGPRRERSQAALPDALHVDFDFAAALTGGLILALSFAWAALGGLTTVWEDYRAALVALVVHAGGLKRLLLLAPVCAALLLVGALGTLVLVALHGWHALVARTAPHVTRLWLLMGASVAAGAALVTCAGGRGVLVVGALLACFGAGVAAVCRRAPGGAALPSAACRRAIDRSLAVPLATAASAAAAVGVASVTAAPAGALTASQIGAGCVLLAVGGVCGAVIARVLLRRFAAAPDVAPGLLLAAAVVWGWPTAWRAADAPDVQRLALIAAAGVAAVVLVGRRVGHVSGRVQTALAWVGGAVAGGVVVGGLLGLGRAGRPLTAALAALILTAVAGLGFVFTRHAAVRLRGAGLLAVILWLLLLAYRGGPGGRSDAAPAASAPSASAAQPACAGWLVRSASRTTRVSTSRSADVPAHASAWDVDLRAACWDTIVLYAEPSDDPLTTAEAARVVRRAAGALLAGGRLAAESPCPALAVALLDWAAQQTAGGGPGAACRMRWHDAGGTACELLVVGPAVSAWLRQLPLEQVADAEIVPLALP